MHRITRRHIAEDGNLHSYRREKLKSNKYDSPFGGRALLCLRVVLIVSGPTLLYQGDEGSF
jgi:hypothetical protein